MLVNCYNFNNLYLMKPQNNEKELNNNLSPAANINYSFWQMKQHWFMFSVNITIVSAVVLGTLRLVCLIITSTLFFNIKGFQALTFSHVTTHFHNWCVWYKVGYKVKLIAKWLFPEVVNLEQFICSGLA